MGAARQVELASELADGMECHRQTLLDQVLYCYSRLCSLRAGEVVIVDGSTLEMASVVPAAR